MRTRFHGVLPQGWRDPDGVLGVPPEKTTQAKSKVTRLQREKELLNARLAPLLDRVKAGSASPEEAAALPQLAEESRRLARALAAAQSDADREETDLRVLLEAKQRARFDEVVAQAKEERAEFERLFRETCLALGSFCASIDEAQVLANALVTVLGMDPRHKNAIAQLTGPLDPLSALTNGGGYRPTMSHGWNLNILVAPLHSIGGNKNG